MSSTHNINIREVAFPAISSMALFSAAILLPPFGFLFSIFCPIPIILTCLYRGQKTGLVSLIAVAIILLLFANAQQSMIFFVQYGLVAVVMAESIRRDYSIDKIVFFSVGASLVLGGALIYLLLLNEDKNLSSFMMEQIEQSVASSLKIYRETGSSTNEIDNIKLFSDKLASVIISSIPALMIVSSSFGVLLNYVVVKRIWNRYAGNGNYFENEDIEKWAANEHIIWLLIVSGMLLLIPGEGLNTIGLNLLIVSLLIYFYQGIAVVLFYMRKKAFPFFLKVIVYLLIIIQPLLLFFVILLGIFDVWADFRKLKYKTDNENSIV